MKLLIHPSQLHSGKIHINGYKHSMVQIIALAVALNRKTLIKNVPLVDDTFVLQRILRKTGCVFNITGKNIYLDPSDIHSCEIDEELSRQIHGSLYLFAAFAARFGKVCFSESGGCKIGDDALQGKRPFKHILSILQQFGDVSNKRKNEYSFVRNKTNQCQDIMNYSDNPKYLSGPCVSSATKVGILLSAVFGYGKILNPYLKNDVSDMLRYLVICGFAVSSDKKHIEISSGRKKVEVAEMILSDCVSEVITYMVLALMNNIRLCLEVSNIKQLKKSLAPEIALIKKIGVNIEYKTKCIIVYPTQKINAVNFKVLHTTIQSDHQPFFALLLTRASRPCYIREYVWKDRFKYVQELNKLGFKIVRSGNKIDIYPSGICVSESFLNGCDTRTVALLIIASLMTNADIEILEAEHLMRGYGDFIENLHRLGANIESIS